jgi:hypothetical protein
MSDRKVIWVEELRDSFREDECRVCLHESIDLRVIGNAVGVIKAK